MAALAALLLAPSGAWARPFLAVSAEAGDEIVFVDPAKGIVLERVKLGARPRSVKLSRDRRNLFVAVGGPQSSGLVQFDLAALRVTKHFPTAPSPVGLDLSPDGRTAYLSNGETNELVVIDLAAGAQKKVSVGMEPQGVSVRPDGKVVYVATRGANEVNAIDAKTTSFLARIDAGVKPQAIVFAPGAGTAFVPDAELPCITILDLKRSALKEQVVFRELVNKTPAPVLQSAVLSPDGKSLYVTAGPGRSVLIVDPAKKALVGTIDGVGAFPRGLAISRDGKKLYTANGPSNDVAIIDVPSRKVEARVAVPGGPWGVVLLP